MRGVAMLPTMRLFSMGSPRLREFLTILCICAGIAVLGLPCRAQSFDPARGVLLRGTVVTMDSAGTIFKGGVLVRSGLIVATWKGPKVPDGIVVNDAVTVDLGQNALIFPGLINLHDHPTFDILPTWPTPSSHAQPALGRPRGNEPYANRYQWNAMGVLDFPSAEYLRLVENPSGLLNLNIGLGKSSEVVKFSEIRALLGGETASQGSPKDPATNNILIRNVGQLTFGRNQIESRIDPIFRFGVGFKDSVLLADLVARMANGSVDAWIVH